MLFGICLNSLIEFSVAFISVLIWLVCGTWISSSVFGYYNFLLGNLILLVYKGANVFCLLAIPTAGLAVRHHGSLLLVIVVLVVDKGRRHEESIVVELWHLSQLWLSKRSGACWVAGLLGGQAERLVVDVGVGAEVCDGPWQVVELLVRDFVIVTVGRLIEVEELLAHCHAFLAVTGSHELPRLAAVASAKQHLTVIVRRYRHLQLGLYVGVWSVANAEPSKPCTISYMKWSWIKPIDVLGLWRAHHLRCVGVIRPTVLLLFVRLVRAV